MHHYPQPGFASARKQRKTFVPSDDTINTAKRRIKGAIERRGGSVNAINEKDLLCFLERNVYNRNRELGDRKKGHFRKVLVTALRELIRLKEIVFDPERYQFLVNYRFNKRRSHHQKYPGGRMALRTT